MTDREKVLQRYPDAADYCDGINHWIWESLDIPRQSLSVGETSEIAWKRASEKLDK